MPNSLDIRQLEINSYHFLMAIPMLNYMSYIYLAAMNDRQHGDSEISYMATDISVWDKISMQETKVETCCSKEVGSKVSSR